MQLFNEYGRCQPQNIQSLVHAQSRRYFYCEQPDTNLDEVYNRTTQALGKCELSLDDFKKQAQELLTSLESRSELQGILGGVKVPFLIPKDENLDDVGTALEKKYLGAVEKAYQSFYPKYEFKSHFKDTLEGRVDVKEGSRHQTLLDKAKKQDVVGWYFPCLTEYSVPASLEQMQYLPEDALLAGGIDLCSVFIGNPALLMNKKGYSPLLWLSALQDKKHEDGAFHFEPYGYNLNFNHRHHYNQCAEYWWGGLTFIN